MSKKETIHQIFFKSSQSMEEIKDETIALVVTSPPYPMIQMWDELFINQNEEIGEALQSGNGQKAFEKMHEELDKVWREIYRVLIPGGIVCINIGDATRNLNGNFQLYSSHARIISAFNKIGFQTLPEIIWRKQTNAPNKFMGSGMLPVGAYVTLEHEYILIFRKGTKREFKDKQSALLRRESAFFWEERNNWFSDLWDLKGISQNINVKNTKDKNTKGINKELRKRSAAFPFEIAYRLINMFSVKYDTILDPFLGTGTTSMAAMVSERNSIGYEIDSGFKSLIDNRISEVMEYGNKIIYQRLLSHKKFIENWREKKGVPKYFNEGLGMHVITAQEKSLSLNKLVSIEYPQGLENNESNKIKEYIPRENYSKFIIHYKEIDLEEISNISNIIEELNCSNVDKITTKRNEMPKQSKNEFKLDKWI
ncbi:MAG: DNA-methyltransferase [Promethearchaeota archaeon]